MHFLFLGVFHKQLEIFRNASYTPKGRLKAFQAMLEEADKNKADSQDKVKETLKNEAVMLFEVCCRSLKGYDDSSNPSPKAKIDAKLCTEVEEIILLLQRLFQEYPAEKIADISAEEFRKLVHNLMRQTTGDKFKVYGFSLLTSYMNLSMKIKHQIDDRILELFENCLPFGEAIDESPLVGCKMLPAYDESAVTERWVIILSKDNTEAKPIGVLKQYLQTMQRVIRTNPQTALQWFYHFKKSWLKYFYPSIYANCLPLGSDGLPIEKVDPKTIGFYPICPPVVHVFICETFYKILKSKKLESVRETVCSVKENIYFMLEVLTQTIQVFKKKELQKSKQSENYLKMKKKFSKYLKGLLSYNYMPKCTETYRDEFLIRAVSSVFCQFATNEGIESFEKDEVSGLISSIDTCLRKADHIKFPDATLKLNIHVFNYVLEATEKIGNMFEQAKQNNNVKDYSNQAQSLLSIMETLITIMFSICLSSATRNDQRVWGKMRQFCQKWYTAQMLILIWQNAVVEATSTLADNLATLEDTDLKVLSEPELNPFEGLPMKKEYSLQVLYNAHTAAISVPPEEAPIFIVTSKYKHVYKTGIYNHFDLWLNLLKLIQLPPGFKDKMILSAYTKSKHT